MDARTSGAFALLEKTVSAIGTRDFDRVVLDSLRQSAGADYCFVARMVPGARPVCLIAGGTVPPALEHDLLSAYFGDRYRDDPNLERVYASAWTSSPVVLPFGIRESYQRTYWDRFFAHAHVDDKLATVCRSDGFLLYTNFYRMDGHGRFADSDRDQTTAISPVLTAAIGRHLRSSAVDRIVDADGPFARLTAREREVCAHILTGHTSEAIALRLEISVNSVLTYRKRAYTKLEISSANELFGLVMMSGWVPSATAH